MGFKNKIYDQSHIYFKAEGLEGVVANYNFECAKLQTSHNRGARNHLILCFMWSLKLYSYE